SDRRGKQQRRCPKASWPEMGLQSGTGDHFRKSSKDYCGRYCSFSLFAFSRFLFCFKKEAIFMIGSQSLGAAGRRP
ncbi:hypothetical protein, partial [Alcanivorax xiamenensis]|uniref:hypothetical protein n=1 Tax=Alcanivorax xiamenensis TaxID=1177156 RepID=UPI001F4577C8